MGAFDAWVLAYVGVRGRRPSSTARGLGRRMSLKKRVVHDVCFSCGCTKKYFLHFPTLAQIFCMPKPGAGKVYLHSPQILAASASAIVGAYVQ